MAEMELRDEVRVAWGTGIAGYVAESGEPVNIPDAYQVSSIRLNVSSREGKSAHLPTLMSNFYEINFNPRTEKFMSKHSIVISRSSTLVQG